MKAAQEAEYAKLVVAGEPLTKKEQRELEKKVSNQTTEEQKTNVQDYDWNE